MDTFLCYKSGKSTKALVTGGSGGIGGATVRILRALGIDVYFTYNRSSEAAAALSKETGAHAVKCDVSKESEVEALKKAVGTVDYLVLNAGVSSFDQLQDITLDKWNGIIGVNLTGAYLCAKAFATGMIYEKFGRIVAVSSMWGAHGSSCEAHYAASKGGLEAFIKSLAKELGPSGITCNAVAPGFIETDMTRDIPQDDNPLLSSIPLGHMGKAEDVADAVAFLASSDYITGEVLRVDGGIAM